MVVADEAIVACHERLGERSQTRYDWQHDIPLVQRKPGALRNGAPFADMHEALRQLRRGLLRHSGGDRVMAQVLAQVPTAGLEAVLVAAELALESGPPSGRVSLEHVVNVLGRLNAAPAPGNCPASTILSCAQGNFRSRPTDAHGQVPGAPRPGRLRLRGLAGGSQAGPPVGRSVVHRGGAQRRPGRRAGYGQDAPGHGPQIWIGANRIGFLLPR